MTSKIPSRPEELGDLGLGPLPIGSGLPFPLSPDIPINSAALQLMNFSAEEELIAYSH